MVVWFPLGPFLAHQRCEDVGIDERLVPDLPRGRGRLVGGDLNVGEEGSE
jgi:hypothetical protein